MLEKIIKLLLALQGKGYGSSSIKSEVNSTRKFVNGGVLFDVGANKGLYSRELLRQYSRHVRELHVFEPSKDLVDKYLTFNDSRVHVVNMALSNASGIASLFKVPGSSWLNSLTKRRLDHFDVQMNDVEHITTITLDDYVIRNNIEKIDLLKIDVEGHEFDVLTGASRCFKENMIKCIQFEFGGCNIDTRTFFQDFWYLLVEKYAFKIYRITPFGVNQIKTYSELDEIFMTTNFLAVKA
jgi:FkbM family methyltransferase